MAVDVRRPCLRCGVLMHPQQHDSDTSMEAHTPRHLTLRSCLRALQHQLTEERQRRERLHEAFAEFVDAVSDYHNEHGCPGFIGARLSDARAALQQEDGDRE